MSRLNVTDGEWMATDTASDYVFCVIRRPGMKDVNVESEQDADLMASSKDLYAALDQAVTSMQDHGWPNSHLAVKEARRALAKARGES